MQEQKISKVWKVFEEYGNGNVPQVLCEEIKQMTGRPELKMLAVRDKC